VIFEPFPEYSPVLKKGKILLIGKKKEAYSIRSVRNMDQNYLIAFDGLEDCDVVGHLRNQSVYISKSELKVREDGGNYPHEVLGLEVIDENGHSIGKLREVLLTGANDVYVVVTKNEEEVLLPAIDSVILKVDVEKKTMTVRLPIWE
jgi:16S rRNA processing protein RimM